MAIRTRGAANQQTRKVKGHATKKDVEEGKSNENDKEGNNIVDGYADIGVTKVGGIGLVKLGVWLTERHDAYIAFMKKDTRGDCRDYQS